MCSGLSESVAFGLMMHICSNMMRSDSETGYPDYWVQNELKNSIPKQDHCSDVKENGLVEHGLTRSDCIVGYKSK